MREALEILKRHKRTFLFPFVVVFCIPTLWAALFGRTYEADSVIWLDSDVSIIPLVREGAAPAEGRPIDKEAETLNQLIKSRSFLVHVIESTTLRNQLSGRRSRERAVDLVRDNLGVWATGANSLAIRFNGRSRSQATSVVRSVSTAFMKWAVESSDRRNREAITFFEGQAALYRSELEKSRKALQRFMERTPNAELLVQRDMLLAPVKAGVSPRAQMNYERLSKEHEFRTKLYDNAMDNLAKARTFAAAEHAKYAAGLRVLDPPEPPLSFSKRRLLLTAGLSLLSAALLGLMAVALAEFTDRTLRNERDVREALGLPVLAVVPEHEKEGNDRDDAEGRAGT